MLVCHQFRENSKTNCLTDKNWTKENALACYESTTTSQRIKELFAEFHKEGIVYGTIFFKGDSSNYFGFCLTR